MQVGAFSDDEAVVEEKDFQEKRWKVFRDADEERVEDEREKERG